MFVLLAAHTVSVFHVISHSLYQIFCKNGLHKQLPPKLSRCLFQYASLSDQESESEATREIQSISVLLHRINEELLHGNLLHGNTS